MKNLALMAVLIRFNDDWWYWLTFLATVYIPQSIGPYIRALNVTNFPSDIVYKYNIHPFATCILGQTSANSASLSDVLILFCRYCDILIAKRMPEKWPLSTNKFVRWYRRSWRFFDCVILFCKRKSSRTERENWRKCWRPKGRHQSVACLLFSLTVTLYFDLQVYRMIVYYSVSWRDQKAIKLSTYTFLSTLSI